MAKGDIFDLGSLSDGFSPDALSMDLSIGDYLPAIASFRQESPYSWMPSNAPSFSDIPTMVGSTHGSPNNFAEQWGLGYDEPGGSVASIATSQGSSPWASIDNTLQKIGGWMGSPGGKLATGLGGGALSAWQASIAKKKALEEAKKMEAMKAARMAEAKKYNAPIRYANARTAVGPYAPGQSAFSNNSLDSMILKAAEGGSISIAELIRRATEGSAAPEKRESYQRPSGGVRAAGGGYFEGGTSGQSDKIPAMLSDGEFVIDADTVAALGDGNNAAGASALEKMRQNVRKHKRSAPATKIPPKAKKPEQYMKKGKK
jgi:hypothetical protein